MFEQSSDNKLEMEIESDKEHNGTHLAEGGSSSRELEAKPEQPDIGTPITANALKLDDDDDGEARGCQNSMFDTFPLLQNLLMVLILVKFYCCR